MAAMAQLWFFGRAMGSNHDLLMSIAISENLPVLTSSHTSSRPAKFCPRITCDRLVITTLETSLQRITVISVLGTRCKNTLNILL